MVTSVGLSVGCVGLFDGDSEGAILGSPVGSFVGLIEGYLDGDSVDFVGFIVGFTVGLVVGSVVGASVPYFNIIEDIPNVSPLSSPAMNISNPLFVSNN